MRGLGEAGGREEGTQASLSSSHPAAAQCGRSWPGRLPGRLCVRVCMLGRQRPEGTEAGGPRQHTPWTLEAEPADGDKGVP